MLLGMRLGKFACVAAVFAAFLGLAGFALAQKLGLSQTHRVSVACIETRPTLWQTFQQGGRAVCQGKPLRQRGLARRFAVARPPSQPPSLPPALPGPAERGEVAPGNSVDPGASTPPEEGPSAPPGEDPTSPGEGEPETPPADTIPPDTSIASGPPAATAATTASFSFSSGEPGSTFECKRDSGTWQACISPKGYSSLVAGPHLFSVRATDAAGNVDSTPAEWSWTVEAGAPPVDNTPPQTSITSGPSGATTATTANFTLSSNENGSSFECKLDEADWSACGTKATYTELEVGSHEFAARAIDPAENIGNTATRNWEVEEPPEPPPTTPPAECTTSVAGTSAVQSAVSAAAGGAVICLADGSYGELSISASKSSQVTVQAEHAGRATIAGASLSGSHITLARLNISNEVTVEPGASSMAIEYNRITGGYMGINAGPTSSTSISDTTIRGNKLVGPFGEDALRINRYHDSGDADPYGILIEGNEITGVRENGNHSDCLQSVWGGDGLYFRRNYLHDNRCQGFFIKDQPAPVAHVVLEDNLMLRNDAPCAPASSSCGPPEIVQIVGPTRGVSLRSNTIWTPGNETPVGLREGPFGRISVTDNVLFRLWSDWPGPFTHFFQRDNLVCQWEGTLPHLRHSSSRSCKPAFLDPAADDYRLTGGVGVDWAPREQHYGP